MEPTQGAGRSPLEAALSPDGRTLAQLRAEAQQLEREMAASMLLLASTASPTAEGAAGAGAGRGGRDAAGAPRRARRRRPWGVSLRRLPAPIAPISGGPDGAARRVHPSLPPLRPQCPVGP